jgi:hypothetical protein
MMRTWWCMHPGSFAMVLDDDGALLRKRSRYTAAEPWRGQPLRRRE